MDYEFIDDERVQITCTFDELVKMDHSDMDVWATPTPQGQAVQLYLGSQKQWRDDFVVASVYDFCEAEGWDNLGWEEMSEEDREFFANDEIIVIVSRWRQPTT